MKQTAGDSKRSKRSGALTLEFAIVVPVIFIIVLGIFEVGRGIMVIHLLNNAALAGCRTGIIEGKSTTDVKTTVNSVLANAGMSTQSVNTLVNDGSADVSTAKAGDEITVTVSTPISTVTWVPVTKFLSGSLQGQYTLRRE